MFEVKSNLYNQWTQLIDTTRQIKTLERNLQAIMTVGNVGTKIPVFAVGYTGYQTVQTIQDKLAEHPESERPDGVLIINSLLCWLWYNGYRCLGTLWFNSCYTT